MKVMNNGVFISFSYNSRELDGIEDLKKELEQSYYCHGFAKWIPSCSEGEEFWLTVFLATKFLDFIGEVGKDILKEGIVSAGKRFVLGPLKDALKKLRIKNRNKWPLRILRTSFVFEDMEVIIGGISDEEMGELPTLLQLIQSVSSLLLEPGCMPIKKIEMPAVFLPSTGEFEIDTWRFDPCNLRKCVWIVTYQDNERRLFDAKDKAFIDVSELEKRYSLLS